MTTSLATRARAKADEHRPAGDGEDPGTLREQVTSLNQQITAMEAAFGEAMPQGGQPAQLIRDAIVCIGATPQLARCDAQTVLGGLMTCAQLGLRPGVTGLGHAWLVPETNPLTGQREAALLIGYRGLIDLAYRHPDVQAISTRTVYTRDEFFAEFVVENGKAADRLVHRPSMEDDRGVPSKYYAVAQLTDAVVVTEHWSQLRMERHRDKYARREGGKVTGPWATHFEQMARKTMIRGPLVKDIPLSTEMGIALAVDGGVRLDPDPTSDPVEATTLPTYETPAEAAVDGGAR